MLVVRTSGQTADDFYLYAETVMFCVMENRPNFRKLLDAGKKIGVIPSHSWLARTFGVSRATVDRWLSGKSCPPLKRRKEILYRLAKRSTIQSRIRFNKEKP